MGTAAPNQYCRKPLMVIQLAVVAIAAALTATSAKAQTPPKSLAKGTSIVDPGSIRRSGNSNVIAWIWTAVGDNSEFRSLGVSMVGIQYQGDCVNRTMKNLAFKAYLLDGSPVPDLRQPQGTIRRVAHGTAEDQVLSSLCAAIR